MDVVAELLKDDVETEFPEHFVIFRDIFWLNLTVLCQNFHIVAKHTLFILANL